MIVKLLSIPGEKAAIMTCNDLSSLVQDLAQMGITDTPSVIIQSKLETASENLFTAEIPVNGFDSGDCGVDIHIIHNSIIIKNVKFYFQIPFTAISPP